MKKIALISGTSSGIGLASAIALAKAGYHVVATMRNIAKADALRNAAQAADIQLQIAEMDVESDASVNACVQQVLSEHGRIDLLLNNAGSGYLGTLEETSIADAKRVMEVNFFGVWRVTQAVLPAMRAARAGHIISVSSIGGLRGVPFNDAYCAAQFAVEGMMESLVALVQHYGIQVSVIEPGPVHTEFVASVRQKIEEHDNGLADYAEYRSKLLASTQQAFAAAGQTPDEIASVIVRAALADQPDFRYPTSEIVKALVLRKYVDATGNSVRDDAGARL
ncbi:MAG: SDR family oxidoreductase [Burkholderiales bacterium]|nr:SDR family oxidoreductase [Burkholderiales bacterium]